jgi:hypothetical protein
MLLTRRQSSWKHSQLNMILRLPVSGPINLPASSIRTQATPVRSVQKKKRSSKNTHTTHHHHHTIVPFPLVYTKISILPSQKMKMKRQMIINMINAVLLLFRCAFAPCYDECFINRWQTLHNSGPTTAMSELGPDISVIS